MKYLCLVYLEPDALKGLTQAQQKALDEDSLAYDAELARRGHFVAASALQPVRLATTIRRKSGKVVVTDGPFAETREVLCGFVFIEAADHDQALELARGIPVGRYGAIEVRPEMSIG